MEFSVDMNALIFETQKASRAMDDILMAWWIPETLWTLFLARTPGVEEAQKEQFLASVAPYTVFVLVDGVVSKDGAPHFSNAEELLEPLRLVDQNGVEYKPLEQDKVSDEAKASLARVEPFFAKSLGIVGPFMHYAVFTAKDAKGQPIANGFADGTFVLKMPRRSFRWRTPLGPLTPPKHCPITGEELPGGWKYNPWNGAKLD